MLGVDKMKILYKIIDSIYNKIHGVKFMSIDEFIIFHQEHISEFDEKFKFIEATKKYLDQFSYGYVKVYRNTLLEYRWDLVEW